MTLKVISAERILFSGEVELVTLPGEMGAFTVLHNHASLVSALVPGVITYDDKSAERKTISIDGGIVDVDNNVVSVCVY